MCEECRGSIVSSSMRKSLGMRLFFFKEDVLLMNKHHHMASKLKKKVVGHVTYST